VEREGFAERRLSRLLNSRVTLRSAARVIVAATMTVVVIGGVAMRLLDGDEYPNIWVALWWALQTVTTVGYGDVTPEATSGRIVATVVMLEGVALIAIVVAVITSVFIAREQQEHAALIEDSSAGMEARFDDLDARLARLEALLSQRSEP
jgi:voltage-gated potassium channel